MFFNFLLGVLAVSQFNPTESIAKETTTEVNVKSSLHDSTLPEVLPTTAEKLVRYRREPPPRTKHYLLSKPRRRLKPAKVRFRPPIYSYVKSSSYKKPLPSPAPHQHTFSFDELKHINFDTSEFDFPPSSYEAQAMDLDFYSDDQTYYGSPHSLNIPYSNDPEPEIPPFYKYKIESQPEVSVQREPHQTYGVPKEYHYSTDFKHSSEASNNYVIDQSSLFEQQLPHESYLGGKFRTQSDDYSTNKFQQDSFYGAPTDHGSASLTSYKEPTLEQSYGAPDQTKYEQKPTSNAHFDVYDKKLTNTAFANQQHFAEPPSKKTNIEITYSPSYEINIPPTNYVPATNYINQNSGKFAEPPPYTPVQVTEQVPEYQVPQIQHPDKIPQYTDYKAPEHTAVSPTISHDVFAPPYQKLPLNPHHRQHSYDYPKSSYEVPIYDPIPFDSFDNDEQEYYPPRPYDINNIVNNNTNTNNNNNNHNQNEENFNQQNSFIIEDNSNNQILHVPDTENHGDTHSSSTSITILTTKKPRKPNRTRKNGRGTSTTSPIKHILDVPELQKAFEAGKRNQMLQYQLDTEVNESSKVEKTQLYISTTATTPLLTEDFLFEDWHPMRIRTTTRIIPTKDNALQSLTKSIFLPTIVPLIRQRSQIGTRNTAQGSNATSKKINHLGNSTSFYSEESPSISYSYVTPSSSQILTNSTKSYITRFKMPTKWTTKNRTISPFKQITKSVYETTYFKSPRNERQAQNRQHLLQEQSLPKNHKLY